MKFIKALFIPFILLLLISSSSCNSIIGGGFWQNSGNLAFREDEDNKNGVGGFLECRWKQMDSLKTVGFGLDYRLGLKGYGSEFNESADLLLQEMHGTFYYNLHQSKSNNRRIDLGIGLGAGRSLVTTLLTTVSIDVYLPDAGSLHISPRISYFHDFEGQKSDGKDTYNFSFGFAIGKNFQR